MASNHHQDEHPSFEKKGINRRRFLKRTGLAAGATTVLSFLGITPFPTAKAASVSDVTSTVLTASQAEPYIRAVLASSDYHRFQRLMQDSHPGIFTVQEQQVTATYISSKAEEAVVVRIPVAGGVGYSFYGVQFKPHTTTILQTQDALFKSAGGHNIDAYAEKNGQVVLHKVLAPDGKPVDGSSLITPFDFFGCMAGCLGIPESLWAVAVAVCCAGVLDCPICFAGFLGISIYNIIACATWVC